MADLRWANLEKLIDEGIAIDPLLPDAQELERPSEIPKKRRRPHVHLSLSKEASPGP